MIAVIVYGSLWVLTIRVGGNALVQHYAGIYSDKDFHLPWIVPPIVTVDDTGTSVQVTPGECGGYPHLRGKAVAYAPFVLGWQWDEYCYGYDSKGRWRGEWKPLGNSDVQFWLLGYRRPVIKDELPVIHGPWSSCE